MVSKRQAAIGFMVARLGLTLFVITGAIGGVSFLVDGYTVVQDGERGVRTQFGEIQGTLGPGFHLMVPLADGVRKYNIRKQAYTMAGDVEEGQIRRDDAIDALTAEGLNIRIDETVRWKINPNKVDYLYRNVGKTEREIIETIVRPTAREATRSCSAQYSVEGIYSDQRDDFQQCVFDRIEQQMEGSTEGAILVEAVQIRNIMLPERVRQAIQEKQRTQEQIETKQNELEIEELEKERRIIEAQGIAESNRIIANSLSQKYLQWYWIQEGIQKGDAVWVVPSNGGGVPTFTHEMGSDLPGESNVDVNDTDVVDAFNTTETGNTTDSGG